jgi:hypothetical protein
MVKVLVVLQIQQVLVDSQLVMDNLNIASLVNPDTTLPVIDDEKSKYQKWLAQNPNGPPVDFATWRAGTAQSVQNAPQLTEIPKPSLQDYIKGIGNALFSPGYTEPGITTTKGNDIEGTVTSPTQQVGLLGNESALSGEAAKTIVSPADALFGTGTKIQDVAQQVGESMPRFVGAAAVGGVPGMIADAGAQRYGETGSAAQAALGAGETALTLGLAKYGGQAGERFVSDQLTKLISPEATDVVGQTLNRGLANEALAGSMPRVGHVAGAVTGGVSGIELGHQIETGGSNPFTVENIASDVLGGAMMAVPESISAFRSGPNVQGARSLLDRLYGNKTEPAFSTETPDMQFQKLLGQSVSTTDIDPQWRRGLVVTGLQNLGKVIDPQERASQLSQLTEAVIQSRDWSGLETQADTGAKMAYIAPPTDAAGLAKLVQQVNGLKSDVLNKLDEMVASGETNSISSTAYKQLAEQGFLKETIDLNWLQKNYDENLQRSLSNSDTNAYSMLVQQLANRQIILAEVAKEARGEMLTRKSIESPELTSSKLEDRRVITNFFDTVSKIQNPEILGQLYDRFNYQESLDNSKNFGTTPKYMNEVTEVVNKIAAGKTPEQLASVDWLNTPVTVQKRSVNYEGGVETRTLHDETVTLGDYLSKDEFGVYTRKVYGRPEGQSQREIAAGIQPPHAALEKVQDLNQSSTWAETADKVRTQISSIDDKTAWSKLVAPALMGDRQLRSDVVARLSPIAKDLVMAIFEAGPKVTGGEEGSRILGEAGKRILSAFGGSTLKDRSEYGQLVKRLNDIFGQGGRDAGQVRQEIIRRAAEMAGVKGPEIEATGESQASGTGKTSVGLIKQGITGPTENEFKLSQPKRLEISNAEQDLYRTLRRGFLNLGLEPELVDRNTTIGLQILNNINNPDIKFVRLSPRNAYPNSNEAGTLTRDDMFIAGVHGKISDSPVIGLAVEHTSGQAPKELAVAHLLGVLGHELVHDIQKQAEEWDGLTPPTIYTKEQIGAWRQLNAVASTYTPQRRYEFLRLLSDMVIPRDVLYDKSLEIDPVWDGNLRYGAGILENMKSSDTEFVNVFAQIIVAGLVSGGNGVKTTPESVFMQLPEEQVLFAKGVYRSVHDMLTVIKPEIERVIQAIHDTGVRDDFKATPSYYTTQLTWLIDRSYKMLVSKEPARSLARAQAIVKALDGKEWPGPIPFVYFPKISGVTTSKDNEIERNVIQDTHDLFFGSAGQKAVVAPSSPVPNNPQTQLSFKEPDEDLPVKVNIGLYWKTLGLVQQSLDHLSRRGLPLANDLGDLMRGFTPMQNRIINSVWEPFLTVNGKPDKTNPLITAINDKSVQGRRDVVTRNKLIDWAQKHSESPLEQDSSGNWQLTQKASKDFVSSDVNQRVIGGVKALEDVGNRTGLTIVHARQDSVAIRVARLIMVVERRQTKSVPWDVAYDNATKIVQGLVYKQPALVKPSLGQYSPDTQTAVMGMLSTGSSKTGATKDSLIDKLQELKNQVMAKTWWVSEQRPGTHLVISWQNGTRKVDGAQNKLEALRIKNQLEAAGYDRISIVDKSEHQRELNLEAPEGLLLDYKRLEQEALDRYLTQNPNGLTMDELNTLRNFGPEPGIAIEKAIEQRGVNKYLIHRRGVPSALGLDYADNMREYVSKLASTVARQHLSQKTALILSDDRLIGQDELKVFMDHALNQLFTPTSDLERSAKGAVGGYYLAANLSSGVVNMFDAVNILPETLVANGADVSKAYLHVLQGIKDVTYFFRKDNQAQINADYKNAQLKLMSNQKLTPEETRAYGFMTAIRNKAIDKGLLQDVFEDQDLTTLIKRQFGYRGETNISSAMLSSDGLYRLIRGIVAIPRFAHGFNNQVAYMAGLEQGIEQGMDIYKATQHADKIRSLGVFAGGKTNMPSYMGRYGNENSIPIMRTFHVLQQYTYGICGRWMNDLSDSVSNDPGLTPLQRLQAKKALGVLTATAITVAGLMGLPIAGLLILSDKIFGTNFEVDTRKGIAWLAGADKDNTGLRGLVTEAAMNGVPNQLLGVNIGPRVGVANAFGLSTYNGFNLTDMVAAASVVSQISQGLGELAQGETQKGATDLAPAFLKRAVNTAFNKTKYGDYKLRDPQGKELMSPTGYQLLSYLSGFNPSQMSEQQRLRLLVQNSNKQFEQEQTRLKDDAAAKLLRGDRGPAQSLAQKELRENPHQLLSDPTAPMRSIANRAAELSQPRDPLAAVPFGNSRQALEIAQTFPKASIPQRSELEFAKDKISIQAQTGSLEPEPAKVVTHAAMIDLLVQKGMTKAQAERVVETLGL